MALIGRVFVILFALFVALFAAGIALSIGILGPQWHVMSGDVGERVLFWGVAMFTSGVTATVAMLPLVIAIIVAEAFSIRSLLSRAGAGAAIVLGAYVAAGLGAPPVEESIDRARPPVSREMELAAVAGLVFGMTYWLIAGRSAGRWRASL